jgi:hypothetical protein
VALRTVTAGMHLPLEVKSCRFTLLPHTVNDPDILQAAPQTKGIFLDNCLPPCFSTFYWTAKPGPPIPDCADRSAAD